MKKKQRLLWLLLIPFLIAALTRINVLSSNTANIYVDPPIMYKGKDESFTVDIKIVDVVNVYSWQVNMSFNPSVLEFVNVTEGDLLKDQPDGTAGAIRDDKAQEGWVFFGWATVGKYDGVSATGTLATVEFKALVTGESNIKLEIMPVWRDENEDGVVDIYENDYPYVEAMGFDKNWSSTRTVEKLRDSELIYPTKLVHLNPPPVPPGGTLAVLIPFTLVNGFFINIVDPPKADFTISPSLPDINEPITFDASACYAVPPNVIVKFLWDFGDGTTEVYVKDVNLTDTTTHAYTAAGAYTVTLTVIDNANATDLTKAVYGTTTMPDVWYELYSTNTTVIDIKFGHNIAVTNVASSKTEVNAGETVSINVTVLNKGSETETFNVTAYYGDTAIETKQVADLAPEGEETLVFNWDTAGVEAGNYQIWAEATVEDEGFPEDNKRIDGSVKVNVAGQSFPTTLVIAAVVVVAVVIIGLFLYMRRRGSSSQ